jgi:nucleotide-binding universal stress UspA family protein
MKKLLIPTDFSESASKAVDYAMSLAQITSAKIYLLNTYAIPHAGATMMVSIDDLLKHESTKNLAKEEARLKEAFPSIEVSSYCLPGSLDSVLKDFCIDNSIDFIIMGTTGASGWEGKLFGSNTANLIGNVKCPIIAIPFECKINKPCNIVISTDLKTANNATVYEPVKQLATILGSSIRYVHITTKDNTMELRSLENDFGNEVDFVYEGAIEEGLDTYLSVNKVDLLVIVAKKHSFFERLFNPSVSKKLAKELTIPMLFLYQE